MWEWSHTSEAYEYAREQLHAKGKQELLDIVSEWNHYFGENGKKSLWLWYSQDLPADVLAGWIWEQASSYEHGRLCSNGGHELYLEPQGFYTVDLQNMPKDWQPEEY